MKTDRKHVRGVFEKVRGSGVWWVCWHDAQGRRHREKVGPRGLAITLHNKRRQQVLQGEKLPELSRKAVRYEELAADLLAYYISNGRKSLVRPKDGEPYVPGEPKLRQCFRGCKAEQIDVGRIREFVRQRQQEGAANATINRSLSALRLMLNLARKAKKVRETAVVEMLPEDNVRTGFVDGEQYAALAQRRPALWLRAMLAVAYIYGWRKSELLSMRVRQVDLLARTLTLDPGTTKNKKGRVVKMTGDVFELIKACVHDKGPTDYVFSRNGGKPIKDFAKSWRTLCKAAGVPSLLFHDLRRSAVRNMERAGIPRSVAMGLTGHKGESTYKRYAIVSQGDLDAACERLESARRSEQPPVQPPAPSAGVAASGKLVQ